MISVFNPYGYTEDEINAEMRYTNRSRHISFRYDLLDKNDVKKDEISGITGAKVSYGEFRSIKRTAKFELTEYQQRNIDYLSDQIQPWLILHMPQGGTVGFPLGIFLLESPEHRGKAIGTVRSIGAYDKTIIINNDSFTERFFIPAGTNYVGAVQKMLTLAGISKIDITPSESVLRNPKEYGIGVTVKEAVNDLLGSINYTSIFIDEMGFFRASPYVEPIARPITQRYGDDIVVPEIVHSNNLAGIPNVFVRYALNLEGETSLISKVTNDNPMSITSVQNRGRRITSVDEAEAADQETLNSIVRRVAINAMSSYDYLKFSSPLMIHHQTETLFTDFRSLFDTPQIFNETVWDMDLKFDGLMSHEARRSVSL